MTMDLHDDLFTAIGRKLTKQEWIRLISENYGVCEEIAKDAYRKMFSAIEMRTYGRVTDDKTPPYTPYVDCGFGGE